MYGLGDLKKKKQCEVRLLKLDKVDLRKKVTQGPAVDEGLVLCEIEVMHCSPNL